MMVTALTSEALNCRRQHRRMVADGLQRQPPMRKSDIAFWASPIGNVLRVTVTAGMAIQKDGS